MVSHLSSVASVRFRVNRGICSFSHVQIGICVLERYIKNDIDYVILGRFIQNVKGSNN